MYGTIQGIPRLRIEENLLKLINSSIPSPKVERPIVGCVYVGHLKGKGGKLKPPVAKDVVEFKNAAVASELPQKPKVDPGLEVPEFVKKAQNIWRVEKKLAENSYKLESTLFNK